MRFAAIINLAFAILSAFGWMHWGFPDLFLFSSGLNLGVALMLFGTISAMGDT